ncbi:unnamed protein product [Dovyalis caffra]|uniref:Pre-mRNA polyadenylation factor Fip1 domain-containing protein n=1 Tax=Dovyalis caffra TaxID=77055 RepID=A0AAV1R0F0_9ROSI|nr:unnamed protein product [Dovyalis caffra]
MDDLIDDDFGDLYADVEIQASSVFNSLPNFSNLCTESEPQQGNEDSNHNKVNQSEKEEKLVSESKELNGEKLRVWEEVDDGSDSEDDLNIVLNDVGCKGLEVGKEKKGHGNGGGGGGFGTDEGEEGCGGGFVGVKNEVECSVNGEGAKGDDDLQHLQYKYDLVLGVLINYFVLECSVNGEGAKGDDDLQHLQYKNVRPYGSSFPSNKKGNESAVVASRSSSSARYNWEDNRCKQHKVNSGQVANFHATTNSVLSHGGYGFSLPWPRSILDVNIDAFEEKRWRYPGVDISDFFNFGFDEDSWKQYCMSLEQSRQQSYMHGMMSILHSSKPTQASESRPEQNSVAMADSMTQVDCSSEYADRGEKQLGLPKGRAIQVENSIGERQPTMDLRRPRAWDSDVVIQDSDDNSSRSGVEQSSHIDSVVPKASKSRDINMDDKSDAHSSGSASRDEPSAESLEGNLSGQDLPVEGALYSMSVSNKMYPDPDNNEANLISNVDGYHHRKVNAHSSEGITEEMETVDKSEEEIGSKECKSDQFLSEPELSLGDHSYFSPSLSYTDSDSEPSRDSVCHVVKDSPSSLRRPSSGTELQGSATSNHKSPKRNSVIRTLGIQNCSSHKSPIWEGRKDHNWRLCRGPEQRIYPNNHSDASHTFRDQPSLDCSRQIEKLHDFDYRNGEDFSYYQQRDPSCGYSGKRSSDDHAQAVYKKHCHRKYHHNFKGEMIPQNRRDWNEKEFFHERRSRLDNQDMCSDFYSSGRILSPENMIPPTYWRSRCLVSKYNNHKEREILRKRKSKNIQFQKTTRNMRLLGHENVDDLMQEKCRRSVPLANQKRFSLNEKCGSHNLFIGREGNPPSRRVKYGGDPHMDLDGSWFMETEEDYCDPLHQHFFSKSRRETYESSDGRWQGMLPSRSDMFNYRLPERYGRPRRQVCIREGQDCGWDGSCNNTVDTEHGIIYPDDQVHLGRRKYSRRSRVLQWKPDESVLRHHVDEFYVERESSSYGVTSTHERIQAKHRSDTAGVVVNDIDFNRHSYKMIREGSNARCFNSNPGRMYRSGHKKMVKRCCDPVDLTVGKVKVKLGKLRLKPCTIVPLPERCSNGRSLKQKGIFEKMVLKFAAEATCSKDFNESQTGNAIKTDVLRTEGNDGEKWLDKFPVTKHNEKLDIDVGQIMAEESNMECKLTKTSAFKSVVPTCNVKKRNFHSENASSRNKNDGAFDDQWILDTIVKMEKRRERFKDPIALKKELDKTSEPQVDVIVDTVPTNQDRPARKRRWGGT